MKPLFEKVPSEPNQTIVAKTPFVVSMWSPLIVTTSPAAPIIYFFVHIKVTE